LLSVRVSYLEAPSDMVSARSGEDEGDDRMKALEDESVQRRSAKIES